MQVENKKIIIVGAGLIGSLWAILLAKRGFEVDIYERRPDMRKAGFIGGRSINLAMSNRGWKALRKAGMEELIREKAIPMKGRIMHDVDSKLTFQQYGQENQAIFSISRGGLNLDLIKKADSYENVNFHFNEKCIGLDSRTNKIIFENTETKIEHSATAEVIFGADGAFSAVRKALLKTPRFNYSQQYLEHGYKELSIPASDDEDFRMDKNALHIWPRGQFMLIALPNIDCTFTCTLFLPYCGAESFENLRSDKQVLNFFKKYFPDTLKLIPDLLTEFNDNPTSPLATIRCNPWQFDKRILLIGDAAHAIVPFYGQGMVSGFEDCDILDDITASFNGQWSEIINDFDANRIKDADAIADLALRNFLEMRDLVADPKFLLRKKIALALNKKYPDFIPVYSMVSFSEIPYSDALKESFEQDKLFEKILSIDDIENCWEGPEVEEIFKQWWLNKNIPAEA